MVGIAVDLKEGEGGLGVEVRKDGESGTVVRGEVGAGVLKIKWDLHLIK